MRRSIPKGEKDVTSPSSRSRSRSRPSRSLSISPSSSSSASLSPSPSPSPSSSLFSLPPPSPSSSSSYSPIDTHNSFRHHVEFTEQPRQLLFLIVLSISQMVLSYFLSSPSSLSLTPSSSSSLPSLSPSLPLSSCLLSLSLTFLTYCSLNIKDGIMVRPHPIFWRITHGISLLYILLLSILLILSVEESRSLLHHFFPNDISSTTHQLQWSMQKDCTITPSTVYRQLSSVWMLSHILGWWGKMLIFRDYTMLMIQSILFEMVEISLQWVIYDFRECWWDSIFIDMLLANMIGMVIGEITLKWFKTKIYCWAGEEKQKGGQNQSNGNDNDDEKEKKRDGRVAPYQNQSNNNKRNHPISSLPIPLSTRTLNFFIKLTHPHSWHVYHWQVFSTPSRLYCNLILILFTLILEITCFFLMYTLTISPSSPLPKYRLLILLFLSISGVGEYYSYMTGQTTRMGHNSWLLLLMGIMEVMICVKYGIESGMVREMRSCPMGIWIPWLMWGVMFSGWIWLYYYREGGVEGRERRKGEKEKKRGRKEGKESERRDTYEVCLDVLFYGSFVPFLWLTLWWA